MGKGKKKSRHPAAVKIVERQAARQVAKKAEKAVARKSAKKGSTFLGTLASYGKKYVSSALDGVAMAEPALLPLRAGIKHVTGFDERVVNPSPSAAGTLNEGGAVVSVADAPVAFARKPITTGFRHLGEKGGISKFWVRDLVGKVTTAATANTFLVGQNKYVSPVTGDIDPNFFSQFEDFVRWRPLAMRVHYVHFAPTSTQCAVMLAWTPTVDAAGGDWSTRAGSTAALMGNEFAVQGSAYEDFALDVSPSDWAEGTWLFSYQSASTMYPNSSIMAGIVISATDANTVAAATDLGYLYVELEFEACDRASPYRGAGLVKQLARLYPGMRDDEEAEAFKQYVLKKLSQMLDDDRKQARNSPDTIEATFGRLYLDYRGSGSTPVTGATGSQARLGPSLLGDQTAVDARRLTTTQARLAGPPSSSALAGVRYAG